MTTTSNRHRFYIIDFFINDVRTKLSTGLYVFQFEQLQLNVIHAEDNIITLKSIIHRDMEVKKNMKCV